RASASRLRLAGDQQTAGARARCLLRMVAGRRSIGRRVSIRAAGSKAGPGEQFRMSTLLLPSRALSEGRSFDPWRVTRVSEHEFLTMAASWNRLAGDNPFRRWEWL